MDNDQKKINAEFKKRIMDVLENENKMGYRDVAEQISFLMSPDITKDREFIAEIGKRNPSVLQALIGDKKIDFSIIGDPQFYLDNADKFSIENNALPDGLRYEEKFLQQYDEAKMKAYEKSEKVKGKLEKDFQNAILGAVKSGMSLSKFREPGSGQDYLSELRINPEFLEQLSEVAEPRDVSIFLSDYAKNQGQTWMAILRGSNMTREEFNELPIPDTIRNNKIFTQKIDQIIEEKGNIDSEEKTDSEKHKREIMVALENKDKMAYYDVADRIDFFMTPDIAKDREFISKIGKRNPSVLQTLIGHKKIDSSIIEDPQFYLDNADKFSIENNAFPDSLRYEEKFLQQYDEAKKEVYEKSKKVEGKLEKDFQNAILGAVKGGMPLSHFRDSGNSLNYVNKVKENPEFLEQLSEVAEPKDVSEILSDYAKNQGRTWMAILRGSNMTREEFEELPIPDTVRNNRIFGKKVDQIIEEKGNIDSKERAEENNSGTIPKDILEVSEKENVLPINESKFAEIYGKAKGRIKEVFSKIKSFMKIKSNTKNDKTNDENIK